LADLDREVEDVVGCATCQTLHHRACFLEHGRCTLLGCTGTETASDEGAPALQLASLHPFLPIADGLIERRAGFLSVRKGERDRRKRRGVGREVGLLLPPVVQRGKPLEATLTVFTSRRIKGQGIRLVVRSVLAAGGKKQILGVAEAVVIGRASSGWLSRLKLWSREPSEQLLLPGTTAFELSFDPSPLAWNGPLPDGDGGRGPRQYLEVHVEIDAAGGAKTEPQRVRLLDGRAAPPALAESDRIDLGVAVSVPALGLGIGERFEARPITLGARKAGDVVATAQLALRHDSHDPDAAPAVDTLGLTLEPLAPGASVLRGEIQFGLHRPHLLGRLTLALTVERNSLRQGKRVWRAYAREAAILWVASEKDADVSGQHRFAFEAVIPPSFFGGKSSDPRRVRAHAIVVGEGTPLRSEEREVRLAGKPARRRARRSPDL
jgi:hypothetical protein